MTAILSAFLTLTLTAAPPGGPDPCKLLTTAEVTSVLGGTGSRAAWGGSEDGAMWVALQGKYLLNGTFAGELADPSRLREPLTRLTTQALAKLGS